MDRRAIIAPGGALIPLRGPSGRLWGMFDPHTQIIEFRHGSQIERIDLTTYRPTPLAKDKANG